MLAARFNPSKPFVMTTFGCQYHGREPSAETQRRMDAFSALLREVNVLCEEYEQEDTSLVLDAPICPYVNGQVNLSEASTPVSTDYKFKLSHKGLPPLSHVWLTYWQTETDFEHWWANRDVQDFWQSLPEANAGFWRETCVFVDGRSMFETNKPINNGFGHVGSFCPLGEKSGYWGAYRDRLAASTSTNKLEAARGGCPKSAPNSSIRAELSEPALPTVVPGRIIINHFPDNLCCVVEGQDRSAMCKREREYWFENFEDLYNEWIQTAVLHSSLASDGVVHARMFHDPSSGAMRAGFGTCDKRLPLALQTNRLVQVIFFQDMSFMERIGRRYSSHLKLRKKFMEAYGPGGDIIDGNIVLWVDLGILKSSGISAEYIGCYENFGFMKYRNHEAFA
ncbi:hypothetical protein SEUCBS139899_008870 [Sporothrix eucalyptigena]